MDGQFLRLFYDLHPGQQVPIRLGIVMGKRHGSAVLRNRVKRRIREAFYETLGSQARMLGSRHLMLSVVIVFKGSKRRPVDRLSYAEIRDDAARFGYAIETLAARDK